MKGQDVFEIGDLVKITGPGKQYTTHTKSTKTKFWDLASRKPYDNIVKCQNSDGSGDYINSNVDNNILRYAYGTLIEQESRGWIVNICSPRGDFLCVIDKDGITMEKKKYSRLTSTPNSIINTSPNTRTLKRSDLVELVATAMEELEDSKHRGRVCRSPKNVVKEFLKDFK